MKIKAILLAVVLAFTLNTSLVNAAQFIIDIPNPLVTPLVEAFASLYSYQEFIDDAQTIPNPETEVQFAKRMVRKYIKEVYQAGSLVPTLEAARIESLVTSETATDQITVQ